MDLHWDGCWAPALYQTGGSHALGNISRNHSSAQWVGRVFIGPTGTAQFDTEADARAWVEVTCRLLLSN